MKRIIAIWKGSLVIKIVTACVVVVALVMVGRCTVSRSDEELVSGALVTVVAEPSAPSDVVVVTQQTEFGGPKVGGLNALRGLVYFMPPNTFQLIDTSGQKPVTVLYTTRLDIAPRSWKSGFPGVPGGRNEWFQIVYEGEIATARAGAHGFELHSDDGSKLFIDDQLVVTNDGRHEPQTASGVATLKPGRHRIRVLYFQGPRFEIALQLFVTPPGGARQILDVSHVL